MRASTTFAKFINKYLFLNLNEEKNENNVLEILICNKKDEKAALEEKIKSTINRRGFNDAVEIHKAVYEEKNVKNDLVVIGDDKLTTENNDELETVLNKNLDNILYKALREAKKDYKTN